jgi:hypothetical protein
MVEFRGQLVELDGRAPDHSTSIPIPTDPAVEALNPFPEEEDDRPLTPCETVAVMEALRLAKIRGVVPLVELNDAMPIVARAIWLVALREVRELKVWALPLLKAYFRRFEGFMAASEADGVSPLQGPCPPDASAVRARAPRRGSAKDIAFALGYPKKAKALGNTLRIHRLTHPDCAIEDKGKRVREATWLYDTTNLTDVLVKWIQAVRTG